MKKRGSYPVRMKMKKRILLSAAVLVAALPVFCAECSADSYTATYRTTTIYNIITADDDDVYDDGIYDDVYDDDIYDDDIYDDVYDDDIYDDDIYDDDMYGDNVYGNVSMPVATSFADACVGSYWTVKVESGYLALRTKKAFDRRNEIGKLYTGDTVDILDDSDSGYWYVYAPGLEKYGYVNKDYLEEYTYDAESCETWTVEVKSGYLALRTEKAFERRNEIGKLYTGDTVEVLDDSDDSYWYVHSAQLEKCGYVNCDYLY